MTIKFSAGLRGALVPFIARPGFLHLYSGGRPPTVEGAPQGVRLCPPIPLARVGGSGGEQTLSSTTPVEIVTGGVVSWGRIVTTFAEDEYADRAVPSICDFTFGVAGSGADIILANTTFYAGQILRASITFTQDMV